MPARHLAARGSDIPRRLSFPKTSSLHSSHRGNRQRRGTSPAARQRACRAPARSPHRPRWVAGHTNHAHAITAKTDKLDLERAFIQVLVSTGHALSLMAPSCSRPTSRPSFPNGSTRTLAPLRLDFSRRREEEISDLTIQLEATSKSDTSRTRIVAEPLNPNSKTPPTG
jgi:hypothetical protein